MAVEYMSPIHASKLALLHRAATFAECHALNKPLFEKNMGSGRQRLLLRMQWPLALSVFDPSTGELLVQSAEGDIYQLSPEFLRNPLGPGHTPTRGQA